MNRFVHASLNHFLQAPITGFGDSGGSNTEEEHKEEESEEQEEEQTEEESDEFSLVIDGEKQEEEPEAEDDGKPAPSWVKDLRKANREDKKRIRELEDLVRKQQPPKPSSPVLGKKPAMEDADIDWDADKFEEALTAWHERKRQIEQGEREQEQAHQQQKTEWEGRQAAYATGKTSLKFRDVAEAEEIATAALDVTQQGIILQGAENSALLIYALGKNPKKAAEMAAIKDPIKFAFAVAKLETKLKTEAKKPSKPPAPETTVRGQARISGVGDSTLEKLREEANRTGDMSKVMAYKRAQKNAKK